MIKYDKEYCKRVITEVCLNNGADPCLFLAMADLESGFDNTAASSTGTYAGLFQLSDGLGGIHGDDRYDPEKCTLGAIRYYDDNKSYISVRYGAWDEWYAYLAHQQGAAGLLYILQNPAMKIKDSKYGRNIRANLPVSCILASTHGDFLECWRKRVESKLESCSLNDGSVAYSVPLSPTLKFGALAVVLSCIFFVNWN